MIKIKAVAATTNQFLSSGGNIQFTMNDLEAMAAFEGVQISDNFDNSDPVGVVKSMCVEDNRLFVVAELFDGYEFGEKSSYLVPGYTTPGILNFTLAITSTPADKTMSPICILEPIAALQGYEPINSTKKINHE